MVSCRFGGKTVFLLSVFLGSIPFTENSHGATATVFCDTIDSMSVFAGRDIIGALREKGYTVSTMQDINALAEGTEDLRAVIAKKGVAEVETALASESGAPVGTLKPQGYAYRVTKSGNRSTYWAIGSDAMGAMYGGLDLGHSIRIGDIGGVASGDHNPYLLRRGLLYSIPLDCRTPNYGAAGDVFSENIEVMWDLNFWKEFLDDMARYHINIIYLWTNNPFPVLLKVPEYPNVSLDDVKRPSIPFTGHMSGTFLTPAAMLSSAKTVKTMTIDEKIAFWQKVMEYGRDRGVSFSLSTFNIHLYSMEGKYGIANSLTNATTKDYFRKAVRSLALTYPLLDGIGTYCGEDMAGTDDEKFSWIWDVYGRGIMDAKAQQAGRKVKFLSRSMSTSHMTTALDKFASFPDTFNLACRIATNVYTTTTPHSNDGLINTGSADGRQIWLEVRNESFFSFRFGDYEFMRAFVKNLPVSKVFGTLWGSNGYMYGRETISTEPDNPRQLMTRKMWYHFMLLGRLQYEPDLPSSLFKKTIAYMFPQVDAAMLYDAWAAATGIIPLVNRFHFSNTGGPDYKWYPEGCLNEEINKITNFMVSSTVESSLMNITTYCDKFTSGQAMGPAATPEQTARKLKDLADAALEKIAVMAPGSNKELRLTMGDIRAMSRLGYYYAEKILGATDKAVYDRNNTTYSAYKAQAIEHLRCAAAHWRDYATEYSKLYKPQWFSRMGIGSTAGGYVDMKQLFETALTDIKLAGGKESDASAKPAAEGSVIEAETAVLQGGAVTTKLPGFTGTGSVDFSNVNNGAIEWTFTAPSAGAYMLQFRYSIDSGSVPVTLTVNGADADTTLSFWTTGASWQTETRYVPLVSGKNTVTIAFRANKPVLVDHCNAIRHVTGISTTAPTVPDLDYCFVKNGILVAGVTLDATSRVTISLFDIKGRLVRHGIRSIRRTGSAPLTIDCKTLPYGFYIFTLSCGNRKITKKLTVIH